MPSNVRAKVSFLRPEDGGRSAPPSGPRYASVGRFAQPPGPSQEWSVVFDFVGAPDLQGEVEARVSFLAEPPPLDLVFRNANFEICEGRRVVGHAQLLPATESVGALPSKAASTVLKPTPTVFAVTR